MTQTKFSRLKVGDKVTLACARREYSCGHKTSDGHIYVPAGTKGVIGAVKVPSVRRDDVYFHCVDFKFWPHWQDCYGKPAKPNYHKNAQPCFRVAALAEHLI